MYAFNGRWRLSNVEGWTGARKRTLCVIPGPRQGHSSNCSYYGRPKIRFLDSRFRRPKFPLRLATVPYPQNSNSRGEKKGRKKERREGNGGEPGGEAQTHCLRYCTIKP